MIGGSDLDDLQVCKLDAHAFYGVFPYIMYMHV
jgi:hypothetical protein